MIHDLLVLANQNKDEGQVQQTGQQHKAINEDKDDKKKHRARSTVLVLCCVF